MQCCFHFHVESLTYLSVFLHMLIQALKYQALDARNPVLGELQIFTWSMSSEFFTASSPICASSSGFTGGSVVVDFLFIVTPIVGVCNCSMYCCTLLYVHYSIATIMMGKRELIALLNLSSWCLVMVERLFLTVPRGCLQFVIVVFPDHTHLLFLKST